MIPDETVERVRESADIVAVIGEYVELKRQGADFRGPCPFHQGTHRNFSVSPKKKMYYCFVCHEGGDVFSWFMKRAGMDYPTAVREVARRLGIVVPERAERTGPDPLEPLFGAVAVAQDWFTRQLAEGKEAAGAREYLESREVPLETAAVQGLGFAPPGKAFLAHMGELGIETTVLVEAGLAAVRDDGSVVARFRGRLMFPIHDLRGDPVGFGGRKVDGIDPNWTNNPDAKYVNSADSIVYHKAQVLFGLDRARREISEEKPAVIVEGYTDVIAMHKAGIPTAVASCGTALGDGHFDLLRRFGEKVVLAFDSDEAGSRAALRGDELESPFRLDLDLRVALMPDGLDPADLVQEGRDDELVLAVEKARPLLERRIEHEVSRHDLSGPEGRARALHAAVDQLKRVNDQIARREYSRFVARLIGVDLETVESAVEGGRPRGTTASANPEGPLDRMESELLRVILADPSQAAEIEVEDFGDSRLRAGFAATTDLIASLGPAETLDISRVADPDIQTLLRSLAMEDRPLASGPEMLARVKERRLDREIEDLERRLAGMEQGTDAHSESLRRLIALQREKRSAARP